MNSSGKRSVVVVGAGIQGLLAALALRDRGFDVRVHSAGADPRAGGITRGSTSDGESIRLITPLEGCPYVGHAPDSPEIAGVFEKPVSQGGWLGEPAPPPRNLPNAASSDSWLKRRQAAWDDRDRVGRTLAWYAETTRRAMTLWPGLRADHPRVFAGVDWQAGDVLRLYDDPATAAIATSVHCDLGIAVTPVAGPATGQPPDGHPWLCDAWRAGRIGGAILVSGYGFNVKRFVKNLTDDLERRGVTFAWSSECVRIRFDQNDAVDGLDFASGVVRADDYVVAPGAYAGPELLGSLGVTVAGLAGRWLLLPTPQGFRGPVKVHFGPGVTADGPRPVLDLNLMPYFDAARNQSMLAVGGGYLHVGGYPFAYDVAEMRLVDAQIESAVARLLPTAYAQAQAAGTLVRSAATCVRSITADDRPAVACRPTNGGGRLIFHAGLNTGTTTMAPAVAADIAAVLAGENGPESLVF